MWRGDREIRLSRKEFELLHALMARAGDIVTRGELMADVWQTSFYTSSKTIDVHLGWLRRKLDDDPRNPTLITTHRGRGLRFETAPTASRAEPASVAAAFYRLRTCPRPVRTAHPRSPSSGAASSPG